MMPGSVTLKKVRQGPAPRSAAASSRLGSRPAKRARTTTTTYDRQNATCARITVVKPSRSPSAAKKSSSDEARTISGTTIGSAMRATRGPVLRSRPRASASAAAVPTAVATIVVTTATTRLLRSDVRICGLEKRRSYQSSVNPPHTAVSRLRLNENTTSTRIGAYRKR
jgi:hypothetical protein